MGASEEVAGLPGGQALAVLAAQVRGNPAAIRDIASSWAEAAGGCSAHAGAVRRAVFDVGHDWQGSSATEFTSFMSRFAEASRTARQALRAAANTSRGAAASLEESHRGVEGICENLLGEVGRLRAANPEADSSELSARIGALVAEAAGEAHGKVAEAQQALERANGALTAQLSQLGRTFSALPQAGSLGFAAAWGRPAGWHSLMSGPGPGPGPGHAAGSGGASGPGRGDATMTGAGRGTAGSPGAGAAAPPGGGVAAGGGVGAGGAAVAGGAAAGGGPTTPQHGGGPAPPAQVNGWIKDAIKILEAQGIPASKLNPADIWLIIQHESGGDPTIANNWDINAQEGHPSIGLMQTIQPTFISYALPGHRDIVNPVDNIIAGVRYALARYGSLDNVPGVLAVHNGQPYVGY